MAKDTGVLCNFCGDESYTEVSVNCGGSFQVIPGLKDVQLPITQADGPTTCNINTGTTVEVCEGETTLSGNIIGDFCYDSSVCSIMQTGTFAIFRTHIPNSLGIVDGTRYYEYCARIGPNALAAFNKDTVHGYDFPLKLQNLTKPIGL